MNNKKWNNPQNPQIKQGEMHVILETKSTNLRSASTAGQICSANCFGNGG